jgi:hypothetical protein
MTSVPKLIQDILSYYQYRDIWKEMVKLLNQEYHNTLDIVDNGWQIKGKKQISSYNKPLISQPLQLPNV